MPVTRAIEAYCNVCEREYHYRCGGLPLESLDPVLSDGWILLDAESHPTLYADVLICPDCQKMICDAVSPTPPQNDTTQ